MASTLSFFMTSEDEEAFLRLLEPHLLEVYPEYCDPGYEPFLASTAHKDWFTEEAYYLSVPSAGQTIGLPIRRGPKKGMLKIDENSSPVIHWERCLTEKGELRSGRLWVELEHLHNRPGVQPGAMKMIFEKIRSHFKKYYRDSQPRGFFVGPNACRRSKQGWKLRESGHKGGLVVPQ